MKSDYDKLKDVLRFTVGPDERLVPYLRACGWDEDHLERIAEIVALYEREYHDTPRQADQRTCATIMFDW